MGHALLEALSQEFENAEHQSNWMQHLERQGWFMPDDLS